MDVMTGRADGLENGRESRGALVLKSELVTLRYGKAAETLGQAAYFFPAGCGCGLPRLVDYALILHLGNGPSVPGIQFGTCFGALGRPPPHPTLSPGVGGEGGVRGRMFALKQSPVPAFA